MENIKNGVVNFDEAIRKKPGRQSPDFRIWNSVAALYECRICSAAVITAERDRQTAATAYLPFGNALVPA
jgi:hypothetical protein